MRLDLQDAPGTLKAHRPVVLGFPGAAGHVVATEVPVSMVHSEALMPHRFLVLSDGRDIDDVLSVIDLHFRRTWRFCSPSPALDVHGGLSDRTDAWIEVQG